VLDVATGDVFYQNNTNASLNRLAFVDDNQAVNDFTFTLVSRILLSTDTDASTFQVNSSKVTREVTIFSNTVFANTASVDQAFIATDRSVTITLVNAEFVQRKLELNDFILPTDFPVTGLAVERLNNTQARIIGLSGLAGTSGLQVASKAIVAQNGAISHTSAVFSGVGVATVTAKSLVINSGVEYRVGSGLFTFEISLSNDTFITSGLTISGNNSGLSSSGVNLLVSSAVATATGIQLTINGVDLVPTDSGLTLHAISAVASAAGQAKVTFELRGTFVGSFNTTDVELGIIIGKDLLTLGKGGAGPVTVLTAREARVLTASPKLTIRFEAAPSS
jgi:hypothetical protein